MPERHGTTYGVGSHHNLPREAVATYKHSVKIMAEKENNQRHESTIDKYFAQTAKAYKTWAEENKEERNFLQIAAEITGDEDEEGHQGFDFHISYSCKPNLIASGLAQTMQKDELLRDIIIEAARRFLITNEIKMKDNETSN